MSVNRRRNATTCRTCKVRRTHHRTARCAMCRSEVPPVQRLDGGIVVLGQIRLTDQQALRLACEIADAIAGRDT